MRVHWKIRFLGGAGRVMKKQYIQGELSYKEERGGTWAICRFKRVVDKKGGGWYPNAHYDKSTI